MSVMRECVTPQCSFRYPDHDSIQETAYCPRCGQLAPICEVIPTETQPSFTELGSSRLHLHVVMDNIRSIYNVGSIFRTSDGFGVEEIHLCGITPTPQNPRFSKTSLGAEEHLVWTYHPNALNVCSGMKGKGFGIISLENSANAHNLYAVDRKIIEKPAVLVVGNELSGIDPHILRLSDWVVAIPMSGYKHSFNVATAFGIAISYLYSLALV